MSRAPRLAALDSTRVEPLGMTPSSGIGQALTTAASWLFAGMCVVVCIVYNAELRTLGRSMLGSQQTGPTAAVLTEPDASQSGTERSGSVELRADRMGHFFTAAEV